jgi:predicted DNA binding CopG/RHH family protein
MGGVMAQRVISEPVPFEVTEEEDRAIQEKIAQAEEDLAEMRVNLRWGKTQIDTVRRAALLVGVPYQTYVKEAAFRQALADLQQAAGAGLALQPGVKRGTARHPTEVK